MLSKDIEEIKYKDSHGREVIPYWRVQDLLKQAKKEVFDDIEDWLSQDGENDWMAWDSDYLDKYFELKKHHLSKEKH